MDSKSQTSADDRSCSCSNLSDATFGVSTGTGCCAKDIVDKLMVLLKEKDEQFNKAKNETLQGKMENLELKAKIRELEQNAEQKANYQALEARMNEVAQMLSTQNEQHQIEMKQIKEQLQDEFSKKLAEQQKQMMAQFQAQFHSLEQRLKETNQRAQIGKNELEEMIQANQQKMEKFREEVDNLWDQLMISKGKILANPKGIVWDRSKSSEASTSISKCGLKLKITSPCYKWLTGIATEGYTISGEHCQKENFQVHGTILYYYEVTITSYDCSSSFGFTDGNNPRQFPVGSTSNSYGIAGPKTYDIAGFDGVCWLSQKPHNLECSTAVIAGGTVFGSGLLLNSKNELDVFFTVDGILLGKQIRINPTVNRLYPTVSIYESTVEANFGDNLVTKPFKYDIGKCLELVFE